MLIAILTSLAALAGGLGIGYFDGRVTEVSVTLGLIFTLNFALGLSLPGNAWRYPLISALSAAAWIWLSAGAGNPHLPRSVMSYAALNGVLFMAAVAGVAIGAALRSIPKVAR